MDHAELTQMSGDVKARIADYVSDSVEMRVKYVRLLGLSPSSSEIEGWDSLPALPYADLVVNAFIEREKRQNGRDAVELLRKAASAADGAFSGGKTGGESEGGDKFLDEGRRKVLKIGFFTFLAGVGSSLLAARADKLVDSIRIRMDEAGEFHSLVQKWILPAGGFHIAAATVGVPIGLFTYRNEEYAIQGIRNIFGNAREIVENGYYEIPDVDASLISIGGSGTNLITRTLLGHPMHPKHDSVLIRKNTIYDVSLEYTMANIDPDIQVKRYQEGKEHTAGRYAVLNRRLAPVAAPRLEKGWMQDDYLIFTRLPLIVEGHDLIVFSGLHGPAIRAIRDLVWRAELSDLRFIDSAIRDTGRAFQAVFRIPALREQDYGQGRTTGPDRIELLRDLVTPIALTARKNIGGLPSLI